MKKSLKIGLYSFLMFGMNIFNVYAAGIDDLDTSCTGMLGNPIDPYSVAWYMQEALKYIRFLGIILCIVLTCMDIFKSIVTDEKSEAKPIATKMMKRLMYLVILFFLPSLVNIIMSFVGAYDTCTIN